MNKVFLSEQNLMSSIREKDLLIEKLKKELIKKEELIEEIKKVK
jgi:hypothetical protein